MTIRTCKATLKSVPQVPQVPSCSDVCRVANQPEEVPQWQNTDRARVVHNPIELWLTRGRLLLESGEARFT